MLQSFLESPHQKIHVHLRYLDQRPSLRITEKRTDLTRNVDQQPYNVGRVQIGVPCGTEPARELIDGLLPRGRVTWPKLTSVVTFPLNLVLPEQQKQTRQAEAAE